MILLQTVHVVTHHKPNSTYEPDGELHTYAAANWKLPASQTLDLPTKNRAAVVLAPQGGLGLCLFLHL